MTTRLPLIAALRWAVGIAVFGTAVQSRADTLLSTTTFSYAGSTQSYTVPTNTTYVVIKAWGAGGGSGFFSTGGGGGFVTARYNVTPGQVLTVVVGGLGNGTQTGGYNGGGSSNDSAGGGGGGGTEVYLSSTFAVWAGGGGGGGEIYGTGGAGGGSSGAVGTGTSTQGGGGTQSTGGSAGTHGSAGSAGTGGTGAATTGYPGGGGGGGYYGGGGGGDGVAGVGGGGGGGGSGAATGSPVSSTLTAGSADVPGGTGDSGYPGSSIGYAGSGLYVGGHHGYALIQAYHVDTAPTVTSSGTQNVGQNQAIDYAITTSGSPAPTSYGASSLPPGLSVNTLTGHITGNPTTAGTYNSTVSATNSLGTGNGSIIWIVTAAMIAPAATVTPLVQRDGLAVSLYRDGTANFGVAWSENLIWQPDGHSINLGNSALGGPTSYTPVGGPGTYYYQFRLVDNYYNYVDQFISFEVGAIQALPHTSGFESADGFTTGNLHRQQDWVVALGSANVSTEQAQAGSNGIKLTPATQAADVRKYFSQSQSWSYIDVYARPVATASVTDSSILDYGSSRIGFVTTSGLGAIYLFDGYGNGTGTWVDTHLRFAVNGSGQSTQWLRLTVRHDYAAHKWDFYVNGAPVDYDLGMVSNAASSFTDLNWWGTTSAAVYFDGFTASTTNPLFTDADHDGMADSWESTSGLSTSTDDRNSDHDGDGHSNVREYFEGTDPNSTDTDAPTAPATLTLLSSAPGSIGLAWPAGTDPGTGASGVAGYNVYRNGMKLNSSLLTTRQYVDTGLSGGTTYTYTVGTVDAAGNVSAASSTLTVATPASATSGAVEVFTPLP